MPRSIGAHSSSSSAAPPPASTRLVGCGPLGARRPGSSAWPVDWPCRPAPRCGCRAPPRGRRRPGSAAAAPSACPRRRTRAAACRAKRGESDRLIDGRGDRLPEPPDERAAALRVREAVEGRLAEQVEQPARPRCGSNTTGYAPGRQLDGLAAGSRLDAPHARPARRASSAPTATADCGGVPAAAVRRDADHLHERVGACARRAALRRSVAQACSCSATVQIPCASTPCGLGHRERVGQRAPPAAGSSSAVAGSNASSEHGVGAADRSPGRCRRAVARGRFGRRAARARRSRRATASSTAFVAAPPDVPVAAARRSRPSRRRSPVAWVGLLAAKRSISERSCVTRASASRPRRVRAARSASSSGVHATPTSHVAEARRAPCRGTRASPGRARPCRSRAARSCRHSAGEQTASQLPQNSGVTPA